MGKFNRELKSATVYKVIFPGATVDKFKKYLKTTLEDDQFDAILMLAETMLVIKGSKSQML